MRRQWGQRLSFRRSGRDAWEGRGGIEGEVRRYEVRKRDLRRTGKED